MRSKSARAMAAVTAITVAVAGCSSSGGSKKRSDSLSGDITVFAASSLTGSFTALGKQFQAAHPGTKVTFRFDASSALATQITQGNKADVFASAAPKNMASVTAAGDAVKTYNFVKNTMEIATPPGNPGKVTAVADLAKSGVKVALCDAAVPCGATAEEVLTNAKVKVTPVSRQPDVKSTLATVESKEVDAGVVYVTDVKAAGAKVTGVPIPSDVNASTTYPISALKKSANPALAKAWVAYVLSADGQKVLKAAGFSSP